MSGSTKKARPRGIKAWVLYWETRPGGPSPIARDSEVVAILPARVSIARVKETLERLYMERAMAPAELIAYRQPGSGPYPARCTVHIHGVPVSDLEYECGHNPVLVARRAESVREVHDDGIEWDEVGPSHGS